MIITARPGLLEPWQARAAKQILFFDWFAWF
jgi:hypothetical protein